MLLKVHTFKHSNYIDTKQDIYLKDVILRENIEKLNACKKNSYTVYYNGKITWDKIISDQVVYKSDKDIA